MINFDDIDDIWTPILHFDEALKIERLQSFGTKDGFTRSFWYHHPSLIAIVETQSVTIPCDMNFKNFPFDKHICQLTLRVVNGPIQFIKLAKPDVRDQYENEKKVIAIETSKLSFDVEISAEEPKETQFQSDEEQGYTYSTARLKISLSRNHASFAQIFIEFYWVTGVFTLLSLVSFTIDPDKVNFKTLLSREK